jgi:hypothetical protein
MIRAGIGLATCMISAGSALAQERPSALDISCGRAKSLVTSNGSVVLGTGPFTYELFVSGVRFCLRPQVTEPAWVRTADDPRCFVGYRCRDSDLDNGR